jgi:Na+/serine symporter
MHAISYVSFLPLLFLIVFLAKFIYNSAVQYWKLRHVPGPFLSGVSRWFFIKSTAKNTLHLDCATLCKKYGMHKCVPATAELLLITTLRASC